MNCTVYSKRINIFKMWLIFIGSILNLFVSIEFYKTIFIAFVFNKNWIKI